MQQQYYDSRQINTDPRENQQVPGGSGYSEQPGTGHDGYKISPPPPKKRRYGLWLVIALLLAIIFIGGSLYNSGSINGQRGNLPAHTFTLTGHGKLVVDDGSGNIHIHQGSANSIIVQGTRYTYGLNTDLNNVQLSYSQQGNTITVTEENHWQLFDIRSIDLDITVPASTDLDLHTGSGDMSIEDISGQIKAETGSGNITSNRLSGAITFTTGSGDIRADQANLQEQAVFKTGSGNIHLNGSLAPAGTYFMQTGSGDITLALPSDESLRLDTSTGSGTVHNDFGATTTGHSPYAALTLHTGSGDIDIQQQ